MRAVRATTSEMCRMLGMMEGGEKVVVVVVVTCKEMTEHVWSINVPGVLMHETDIFLYFSTSAAPMQCSLPATSISPTTTLSLLPLCPTIPPTKNQVGVGSPRQTHPSLILASASPPAPPARSVLRLLFGSPYVAT